MPESLRTLMIKAEIIVIVNSHLLTTDEDNSSSQHVTRLSFSKENMLLKRKERTRKNKAL